MEKSVRLLVGLLVSAFMLAGVTANPAMAQDKGKDAKVAPAAQTEKGKATVKVLVDNNKVRVTETRYRPGDVNIEDRSYFRVTRTLQGGTLERTYPDGKKESYEAKTGDVAYREPSKGGNYTTRNTGKSDIVNYSVRLK